MGLFKIFSKKAQEQDVAIPVQHINIILRSRRDLLVQDDDFCNFMAVNLDIRGAKEAKTFRYLADPQMRYMPDKHFNAARPMVFYGSEGFFMMSYVKKRGEKGLGIILRDRIECFSQAMPDRHIVLGLDGTIVPNAGAQLYKINKILRAHFNPSGAVAGIDSPPPTAALVQETVSGLGLCIEQMQSGQRLRAKDALQSARYMGASELSDLLERFYPSQKLDNSAPAP
jgi:hypothetical protein